MDALAAFALGVLLGGGLVLWFVGSGSSSSNDKSDDPKKPVKAVTAAETATASPANNSSNPSVDANKSQVSPPQEQPKSHNSPPSPQSDHARDQEQLNQQKQQAARLKALSSLCALADPASLQGRLGQVWNSGVAGASNGKAVAKLSPAQVRALVRAGALAIREPLAQALNGVQAATAGVSGESDEHKADDAGAGVAGLEARCVGLAEELMQELGVAPEDALDAAGDQNDEDQMLQLSEQDFLREMTGRLQRLVGELAAQSVDRLEQ